ncbi:MAG: hypothetical protein ABI444_12915 [Candidatus Kapaibacterium sp.]|jgi:hypothetical protein
MSDLHHRLSALLIGVIQDLIRSLRTRQALSYVLFIAGLIVVIAGQFYKVDAMPRTIKIISALSGASISSLSFLPITEIMKGKLKINTLQRLQLELSEGLSDTADTSKPSVDPIEAIVLKVVENIALS